MDKKFVYISGPISSDRTHYRERFGQAAAELREAGYIPVNPAVLPEELEGGKAMRVALAMLEISDEVALLPGWEHSGGAKIEKRYAEYAGKPVREWKPISLVEESDVPVRYMKPKELGRANTERNRSRAERMFGPKANWNTPATDSEQVQEAGYEARGFLIAECEHCGRRRGFCVKQTMKYYTCEYCGGKTKLKRLRLAHVNCPNCGRKATYKTNATAERFPFSCFWCGKPLEIRKSRWSDVYVTAREEEIPPETEKIPTGGGEISDGA